MTSHAVHGPKPNELNSELASTLLAPVNASTSNVDGVVDAATPSRRAAQALRNTLRLNAATSLIGGLVCVAAGGWMASLLGTGHSTLVRLVGVGLVGFAFDVALIGGARMSRLLRWAPLVSIADAAWVMATVATIAAGWYSTTGAVIVAAVGAMVSGFGLNQLRTWNQARLRSRTCELSIDEVPPVEVVHVERRMAASRPMAWAVVTDHDLYGRLAPNLSDVHVQSGSGADLVRVCSNNNGEQWTETCTVWDEGERFEVNVHTDNYPYPLAVMRGSWWVHGDGDMHCIVGMDFRYQPRTGVAGRLFAALMQAAFPFVLRRILNGWRAEIIRRTPTTKNPEGTLS